MPAIGRYSIIRKIADGGMAELYLGVQHGAAGFERPVVIKAIRRACSADPHFRNVLVDEAHIAMSLSHSNIAQVLDLGEANGRYFLILELVDGWDLERVRRRAEAAALKLPPTLALHIVAEVCRALAFAHGKRRDGKPLGIVHRDVSPHNILISEQGEVKLTDFGIATAAEKRERTVTGLIKGKVGFMSPEQAEGQPLDARSDLFALGTVLYLLATGKQPFAAPTELETLLRTKEARYPPPEELAPEITDEVAHVIRRALQRDPDDRYASAEEMLAQVERVMRSAFDPVGPSELKRWLATLAERDHEQPIGKLSVPAMEISDDEILSVEGKQLALADVDPRRRPPPPPETTPAGGSDRPRRRSRAGLWLLAIATAGAGGAYLQRDALRELALAQLQPKASEPEPAQVDAVAPAPSPALAEPTQVDAGASEASASSSSAAEVVASDAGQSSSDAELAGALAAAGADAGIAALEQDAGTIAVAVTVQDAGSIDGGVAQVEVDAGSPVAKLLAAPDAGEAHAAAHAHEPAAPVESHEPSSAPTSVAAKESDGVVSVKMTSSPPGAHVFVENRALGVTPTSLRFRTGLAYQVRVELDGYEPAVQRVFVTGRKNQAVQATLRKRSR